jgi:hypothetical protein
LRFGAKIGISFAVPFLVESQAALIKAVGAGARNGGNQGGVDPVQGGARFRALGESQRISGAGLARAFHQIADIEVEPAPHGIFGEHFHVAKTTLPLHRRLKGL